MFKIENTLGVTSYAAEGDTIRNLAELRKALERRAELKLPWRLLGAGSNIIPLSQVHAYIGKMAILGIEKVDETQSRVIVRVGAGENWDDWVRFALSASWYGLENLVSIPGSVGAAPIQNIGAYGVEVAGMVESVECVDELGNDLVLPQATCEFGYRTSIFKRRRDLCVVAVNFKLRKSPHLITSYPDVAGELTAQGLDKPSATELANVIAKIRANKLPAPAKFPNVGSFFQNPVVEVQTLELLKEKLPNAQSYPQPDASRVKLSAAQLIDSLNWKNRSAPGVYCWPQQPLVLVNSSTHLGEDVIAFAEKIRRDVEAVYDIQLELEPSVLS